MIRRLAYVLRTFPKVSETFVAGEAAEVLRRDIDVRILSLDRSDDGVTHEIVERAGLAERTVYGRERFLPLLREFRPDLLHAHFATEGTAEARRLASELGLPFTFTAHRYDIYAKAPPNLAERIDAAAAVVTVSRANVRHLTRTYGVSPRKLHVIPCGVDAATFRPGPGFGGTPLVVCVARLKPIKNHALLLEACALLAARGVPFRCVLVGDGPTRGDVEALRERLGLGDRVELVGAAEQAEVLRWWRRASVAVLTSEYEGVPVCLMEAGACAVPAVATAVGGVPELVEDGVTGFLVSPGDAEAVAERIERLVTNPALAARMGAAARDRVERDFSVTRQVDRLLAVWNSGVTKAQGRVSVDPFGVAADPELPTLPRAIDSVAAPRLLVRSLPRLAGPDGLVRVRAIRVTRYKPGRRCVIEYDVDVDRPSRPVESLTLLGKVRRRRSGRSAYALMSALWDGGFADDADDGIVVPEPLGVVPELRMWLQRRVSGRVATELLEAPGDEALARRIAEAAHKIHAAGVPSASGRRHTMQDELRILHECVPQVARAEPQWQERISRLLRACDRLGRATPASPPCWIHRDFYGDQVIAGDGRLHLIDFDQYCYGDPAVDVGNFLGHVTEQSLRVLGDPDGLAGVKRALEERFLELSPRVAPATVRAYELLTLVRHVYVSMKFTDRRPFTEDMLSLCEELLPTSRTYARA